jgi:PKD repeat protein
VTVQWATADGTAAAGVDYIPGGPSTVTFAPGETAKTITVQAIGDTEVEGDEIFFVNLSAPANATIADGQGEVTIVDDDEAAPVVPDPAIVVEGCARVGAACTLSARSLSNGSTASWTYQWKLDGVVESTTAVWKPTFAQPGIHGVSLRVTNAAGIGEATATLLVVPATCPSDALCTLGGRFQLTLAARDHRTGNTGPGLPLQKNDLFGYFALPALTSNAENPEVFVKMLDGREINGNFWTFFGGLTDLEYTLSVRDALTGQTKTYFKPGGSSAGGFDVGSGPTPETCAGEVDGTPLPAEAPSSCLANVGQLCLANGRFRVELAARDQRTGATGSGSSIPQGNIFGYFSIPALTGSASNPEVFVKVLDATSFSGHFWVFFSGLTDLEYTLTVTDTVTGKRKSYRKAPGSACGAFDTNAFPRQ